MPFSLPSAAPEPTHRARLQAIVLAFVALSALAIAATSYRWFVLDVRDDAWWGLPGMTPTQIDDGFGIVSHRGCYSDYACDKRWTKEVIDLLNSTRGTAYGEVRASLAFPAAGIVALGCLAFGAGGLLVAAVLAGLGRRLKPPVGPTTVAQLGLAISLLGALVMTWTRPEVGELLRWKIGWAWWTFAFGAIAGIVAARSLGRHLRGDGELPPAREVVR